MSSNIEIQKTCTYCYKEYIAKTIKTRYCSHDCNRKDYKHQKRQEKIQAASITSASVPKWDISFLEKDLLSISDAAHLLFVSHRTIFRLIAKKAIRPVKFGRSVRIPKAQLLKKDTYDILT